MGDFHCDTFEMRIRFEPHEMNTEAFLKAVADQGISMEPDADGDTEVTLTFPGDKDAHHAHLTVNLWKSGRGRAELSYHSSDTEKGAKAPSSADNCAQWLGEFFRDKVTAHVHVNYTFDKLFTTTITLPFPLVTSEKGLAGALVSGLALVFPNDAGSAIIQRVTNETFLFVRQTIQVDLKDFSMFTELERLSELVNNLVVKQSSRE